MAPPASMGSRKRRGTVRLTNGLSRHDLVLTAIPTVFLAAVLVGHVAPVPVQSAITGASVAAAVVADARFLNPPRGREIEATGWAAGRRRGPRVGRPSAQVPSSAAPSSGSATTPSRWTSDRAWAVQTVRSAAHGT